MNYLNSIYLNLGGMWHEPMTDLESKISGSTERNIMKALDVLDSTPRPAKTNQPKLSAARARFLAANARKARTGVENVQEGIGVGEAISRDWHNRPTCFWDFADRWSKSRRKAGDYDKALCDSADSLHLDGECASEGERLLAALDTWSISTPRFRSVLRCWQSTHFANFGVRCESN